MMDLIQQNRYLIALLFSSGGLGVTYPLAAPLQLGSSRTETVDEAALLQLASRYAEAHPTMRAPPETCVGGKSIPSGVARAAVWRPEVHTPGDYAYQTTGAFALGIHLGCCRFPEANQLEDYWQANLQPLLRWGDCSRSLSAGEDGLSFFHCHYDVYSLIPCIPSSYGRQND